ncbi:MAG: hypothetical protein ACR2FO_02280 [Actinomycetota bacterium]
MDDVPEELPDQVAITVDLANKLYPSGDPPSSEASDEDRVSWLLSQLLDFYRREAKPDYWAFYRRVLECTEQDLLEDSEAVAGLEYVGEVEQVKQSIVHRYSFDASQDQKLSPGDVCDRRHPPHAPLDLLIYF